MMHPFRQLAVIIGLNMRGLLERPWASLVIVIGIASVVAVLVSLLSFSAGAGRVIVSAADPTRAIVVRKGRVDEAGQQISREVAAQVMSAPGIKKDADGMSIASTENINLIPVKRRRDGVPLLIIVRGVGAKAFELRPELHLVSGRRFRPGNNELIAGTAAQRQFEGLEVGDKVILANGEWQIVGAFETGGDLLGGQLLGDINGVMASRDSNAFGSIVVRLESPEAFDPLQRALAANPALDVEVQWSEAFYRNSVGEWTSWFTTMAYLLGSIMALGALFATLNIMHTAVRLRAREIATLRALGFGAAPVAASVIVEVLILALAGAVIGAAVAWVFFNGNANDIRGRVVFNLAVTPRLVAIGTIWALIVALLGSAAPAIRSARLPVATALRAA
jgi:putative ABC transport system permease protein